MKKGLGCLAAVVVLVVILAVVAAGSYNRLVGLSQAVDAQWAQVRSRLHELPGKRDARTPREPPMIRCLVPAAEPEDEVVLSELRVRAEEDAGRGLVLPVAVDVVRAEAVGDHLVTADRVARRVDVQLETGVRVATHAWMEHGGEASAARPEGPALLAAVGR